MGQMNTTDMYVLKEVEDGRREFFKTKKKRRRLKGFIRK